MWNLKVEEFKNVLVKINFVLFTTSKISVVYTVIDIIAAISEEECVIYTREQRLNIE